MFNIPQPPESLIAFYSSLIKDSPTMFMVVFTGILAWYTYGLAKYTKILARETEWARLESGRPEIVVSFERNLASYIFVDLVISNVGRGAAESIRLMPRSEIFYQLDDTREKNKLSEKSFLQIPLLKPGQNVRAPIGMWKLITPTGSEFLIEYTCLGITPKHLKKTMWVSLDYMKDIIGLGQEDSRTIAESTKKMATSLEKMMQSNFELRVRQRTEREARAEQNEQLEELHKMLRVRPERRL